MRKKVNKFSKVFMVLVLILLDQIIKIVVKAHYDSNISMVKNILYFKPVLNTDYSWLNSIFEFGTGRIIHIVGTIFFILIIYFGYKFYNHKYGKSLKSNILEVFCFGAAVCSLMDKIFWNGSLDYIMINGLFTFDLKDCYITIWEVSMFISLILNWEKVNKINGKEVIVDYFNFIRNH